MNLTIFVLFMLTSWTCVSAKPRPNYQKVKELPPPDGNLHVYALPIGQGDSHVIQCPSGELTIFDMGSNDYDWDEPDPNSRFMTPDDIISFFGNQRNSIQNIFVTHNHYDHYVLLVRTFDADTNPLPGLENMYISCTEADMAWRVDDWVNDMDIRDKIRLFNSGEPCGPNGIECDPITLCPSDSDVTSWIMGANLGGCLPPDNEDSNYNMDSILLKLERSDTSILLTGDFEDATTDWNEDGLQKLMVDYYGSQLVSTVFALSHHGASYLANKPVFQGGIQPKALFASANTEYSYRHPRCSVMDGFIIYEESLCKPSAEEGDEFYCGQHPLDNIPPADKVQGSYMCGDNDCTDEICLREDNDYAIYTTVPDQQTIQLVEVIVDSNGNWGFQTNIE